MYFLVLFDDRYLLIRQYDECHLGVYSFLRLCDLEDYMTKLGIEYDDIKLARCVL